MTMIDTGSNKRQYSQRPKDQGGDTFHQNGDWIKQRLSKKPNVPDVGHYMKGWIYHQWTCFDFVKHGKFCSAQQVEGDGVDPQSLIEENGSMGIFTDSTVKKQAVKNGIVRISLVYFLSSSFAETAMFGDTSGLWVVNLYVFGGMLVWSPMMLK